MIMVIINTVMVDLSTLFEEYELLSVCVHVYVCVCVYTCVCLCMNNSWFIQFKKCVLTNK